ncbi:MULTISPECIES: hypothetical protein [unclassified Isoptericola]|uniref:hypothetical protein n=1 Tax=unclassified Isoptericola TaxID=2623355 RepID=UPI00365C1AFF
METPADSRRVDARSVAITGLATLAWYAVPDVVGPRWARALTKVAVLGGGVALVTVATQEGRSALDGLREVRDELRDLGAAAADAVDGDGLQDGAVGADGAGGPGAAAGRDDNVLLGEAGLDGADPLPDPVVVGVAAGAAVVVAVVVAVAGEKWAYRRGERWRARGLRLPHTRVGLLLGAAAAAATALDPSAARSRPEGG